MKFKKSSRDVFIKDFLSVIEKKNSSGKNKVPLKIFLNEIIHIIKLKNQNLLNSNEYSTFSYHNSLISLNSEKIKIYFYSKNSYKNKNFKLLDDENERLVVFIENNNLEEIINQIVSVKNIKLIVENIKNDKNYIYNYPINQENIIQILINLNDILKNINIEKFFDTFSKINVILIKDSIKINKDLLKETFIEEKNSENKKINKKKLKLKNENDQNKEKENISNQQTQSNENQNNIINEDDKKINSKINKPQKHKEFLIYESNNKNNKNKIYENNKIQKYKNDGYQKNNIFSKDDDFSNEREEDDNITENGEKLENEIVTENFDSNKNCFQYEDNNFINEIQKNIDNTKNNNLNNTNNNITAIIRVENFNYYKESNKNYYFKRYYIQINSDYWIYFYPSVNYHQSKLKNYNSNFLQKLSNDIFFYYTKTQINTLKLNDIKHKYLNEIKDILTVELKSLYEIEIIEKGSFFSNLSLEHSDIDILIYYKENNKNQIKNKFSDNLRNVLEKKYKSNIQILGNEYQIIRVNFDISNEIIKLPFCENHLDFEKMKKFTIDISFTDNEYEKTQNINKLIYIKGIINRLPALKPAFLVLKKYFSILELNTNYKGLSSYSLLLLSINICQKLNSFDCHYSPEDLLLFIFREYNNINFPNEVIDVNENRYDNNIITFKLDKYKNKYKKFIKENTKFYIIDISNNNVAKNSKEYIKIKSAFKSGYWKLFNDMMNYDIQYKDYNIIDNLFNYASSNKFLINNNLY